MRFLVSNPGEDGAVSELSIRLLLKHSGRAVRTVTASSLASWKRKGTLRTFIPISSVSRAQLTTRAGLIR